MCMKFRFLLIVVVVALMIIGCSLGTVGVGDKGHPASTAIDLPDGVNESQWKPLAPGLGLVIRSVEAGRTVGYFMHKVDGKWLPLVVQNPPSVVPAS